MDSRAQMYGGVPTSDMTSAFREYQDRKVVQDELRTHDIQRRGWGRLGRASNYSMWSVTFTVIASALMVASIVLIGITFQPIRHTNKRTEHITLQLERQDELLQYAADLEYKMCIAAGFVICVPPPMMSFSKIRSPRSLPDQLARPVTPPPKRSEKGASADETDQALFSHRYQSYNDSSLRMVHSLFNYHFREPMSVVKARDIERLYNTGPSVRVQPLIRSLLNLVRSGELPPPTFLAIMVYLMNEVFTSQDSAPVIHAQANGISDSRL